MCSFSDTASGLAATEHNFQFQQIRNVAELIANFQNQQNLIVVSFEPLLNADIVELISCGFLTRNYFLAELSSSMQWHESAQLRLDSKYKKYCKNICFPY